MTVLTVTGLASSNTWQTPDVNLWGEVECLDGRVEREVREVGVAPGEGRHPLTVSWPGHSPELLASPEQPPVGDLHVESPVALVAHHVVQLLPLTDRAGEAEVAPVGHTPRRDGFVAALHYSGRVGLEVVEPHEGDHGLLGHHPGLLPPHDLGPGRVSVGEVIPVELAHVPPPGDGEDLGVE